MGVQRITVCIDALLALASSAQWHTLEWMQAEENLNSLNVPRAGRQALTCSQDVPALFWSPDGSRACHFPQHFYTPRPPCYHPCTVSLPVACTV